MTMTPKQIREEALLTQKEFAKILGVSVSTVQGWEQNNIEPRISTKRLLKAFCEQNNIKWDK